MIPFVPFFLALALTPSNPGFHQLLKCNQGYITVDVAVAEPNLGPHVVVVTTGIASGPSLTKTRALRETDAQGNVYALGYVLAERVTKRFPRRLLLPAAPPAPGERSSYFNVSGIVVDKRYDGTRAARDAHGHAATGYAFSDYLSGRKLNTVVYVPSRGITEARFFAPPGRSDDVLCRLAP